jgi:uncharacterized membrane protein
MDGIGPLQLLVINFHSAVLPQLVHAQIDDLRRRGLMRLVDSVVVIKDDGGDLINLDTLDAPRGDPLWGGVLARSFFGSVAPSSRDVESIPLRGTRERRAPEFCVTEEQLLELADLIPTNSHALILLIEHIWTAELDTSAMEADGHVIANCWISPSLLGQIIRSGHFLFH